jgi:hypothetical protein
LANQRLLIEARIAEFKARQAVLDAEANVVATEQNNRKAVEAAQLALTQAQAQAPGRERNRAVADAEARLRIAQSEAATNSANAAQGIELARQQAGLAEQNTQATIKQVEGQNEVKRLQTETLNIQQQTTLEQFRAVEGAKAYANELERARIAAEAISKSRTTTQPQTLFNGAGVQTIPGFNLNTGATPPPNNRDVVDSIKSLQSSIESRPPTPIVANFNAPDDDGMDKLFKLQRAALRIT